MSGQSTQKLEILKKELKNLKFIKEVKEVNGPGPDLKIRFDGKQRHKGKLYRLLSKYRIDITDTRNINRSLGRSLRNLIIEIPEKSDIYLKYRG